MQRDQGWRRKVRALGELRKGLVRRPLPGASLYCSAATDGRVHCLTNTPVHWAPGPSMPELPEVEAAARQLRAAVVGKRIVALQLTHPSLQRRASKARLQRVNGRTVASVLRRGKHQLLQLDDGSVVHVHFRMAGDWVLSLTNEEHPRHARAVIDLDDGTRVALVDPRALSTVTLHDPGALPDLGLGPEPDDPSFGPAWLATVLGRRRSAIKPALLDQRVVAGVGNIYAAEALWRARISPLAPASSLDRAELRRLVTAIRHVLDAALRRPGRYAYEEEARRLAVYDREGEPCRRCRAPIARIVQAQRSTYYCPGCQLQRPAASAPRSEDAARASKASTAPRAGGGRQASTRRSSRKTTAAKPPARRRPR